MNIREWLGLIFSIGGVILFPLGWIMNSKILVLAFTFLILGLYLFYTTRMIKREESIDQGNLDTTKEIRGSSGDIHNYKGTHTGGRRDDPEIFFNDDDGD